MDSSIDDIFQRAIASFQAGKLDDAERSFKKLLQAQPDHIAALNLLGILLTQLRRYDEAEHYVRLALEKNAKSDATFYNYGIILKALKRPAEALDRFSEALAINSAVAETWNNRGTVFNDLKRYDDAISDFDNAISLKPDYSDAYCNKGKSLTEIKRYDEALAAYDQALKLKPDLAEAWLGRGKLFYELKRYDEAIAAYDKALTLKPDLADAWIGLGNAFSNLKHYDEAFAAFDQALVLNPDFAEAWLGRGNLFNELKRYDEAFAAYDKALTLKPDFVEAWLGRGNVFYDLKRQDEAFAAYDKALVLKSDFAEAWLGRGNLFYDLKRYDEAITAYDKALTLKPDLAEVWLGRGNLFDKLKRYDEAFAAYDKALTLKPDLAEAWLGRGNIFSDLKRYDDAFAAYDKALTLKPDFAEAWLGRGNLFNQLKRFDEAFAAYDKAFAIKSDLKYAESSRLHAKMHLCDWSNFESECSHLISAIREGAVVSSPFPILAIPSSPADQLKCAKLYVADSCPASSSPLWKGERYRHDKIRIAYLSADFRGHALANLIAELFERHDRSRFEVYGFSFGPDDKSEMRSRIAKSFDQFHDVRGKSDLEVARWLRELESDIVIDLMGHTGDSRTMILAYRPASIQVNYIGYTGTTGADFIDYVIADKIVLPFDWQPYCTEKIVHLPNSFFVLDTTSKPSPHIPTRSKAGLPEKGFVFCCFNNSYKIAPPIFDIWMRLLKAVDGSVLWLVLANDTAMKNLRLEASARGINQARLVFAKRVKLEDYLAQHRLADLFLDTLPFNAHSTGGSALWAGLPVLTCKGDTFAGRVGASMLTAIGIPDLITHDLEGYETLARKLATDPSLLAGIRRKLEKNRTNHPLFDIDHYRRDLEAAYTTMWEISQRCEPSRSFAVEPG